MPIEDSQAQRRTIQVDVAVAEIHPPRCQATFSHTDERTGFRPDRSVGAVPPADGAPSQPVSIDGIVRPTLVTRPVTQGDVEVVSLGAAQSC
jgi:hypothetical protein